MFDFAITTVGFQFKLEICIRSNPLACFTGFYILKYPRERFENANICISPIFQETVGSHVKPSLPVLVMATLNQFNSNLLVFSVNSPLVKISQYHRHKTFV